MIRTTLLAAAVVALGACGSHSSSGTDSGTGVTTAAVTYYKDVLPITQASCNGCHVAGGIAPFALDSYEAAKLKAPLMADAVTNKRMPPWLASADCGGPFVGDRSLSAAQIATLNAWFQAGAPEGNPADAPPAPVAGAGQLPKVDLSITMPQPYTPTLKDDYRCFLIDPALQSEQVVTGYDITPGSRRVVHHVIMYVVPRAAAVAKDAEDTTAGWQCFGGANVDTTGTIGAWAPGGSAVVFPTNTGIRVKPNEVIAMQVHYNTENAVEADQTSAKLMFGTGTERSAYLLPLVAAGFNIPPNTTGYNYKKSFPNSLGFPIDLWGFLPHMHTRGKKINLHGGADNACIVDIQQWDFHWQSQYFRKTPIALPAGNGLTIDCTWDNPGATAVTWGEGTSDEMCFAYAYATL